MKKKVTITEAELRSRVRAAVSSALNEGMLDKLGLKLGHAVGMQSNSEYMMKMKRMIEEKFPGYSIMIRSRENIINDPNCVLNDHWAEWIDDNVKFNDPSFKIPCIYKKGSEFYAPINTFLMSDDGKPKSGMTFAMDDDRFEHISSDIKTAIAALKEKDRYDRGELRRKWKDPDYNENI